MCCSELVEEQLMQSDGFHTLVDEILDDVQTRFDLIKVGSLVASGMTGRVCGPTKRTIAKSFYEQSIAFRATMLRTLAAY